MTLHKSPAADKPAGHSLRRLAAANAACLLIALGTADKALAAAVDCGAKTAHRAATAPCRRHHPPLGARPHAEVQKIGRATAGPAADGDELTPATARRDQVKRGPVTIAFDLADVTLPVSIVVHRLARAATGPSPWSGRGAPAGNRWPASADAPMPMRAATAQAAPGDSAPSLRDLVGGDGMPAVPAPVAWAILLLGVLGLRILTRPPRVARVQSWATRPPSKAAWSLARAKASRSALDRIDPERYARVEVPRQGHFVRASAPNHFGADR